MNPAGGTPCESGIRDVTSKVILTHVYPWKSGVSRFKILSRRSSKTLDPSIAGLLSGVEILV